MRAVTAGLVVGLLGAGLTLAGVLESLDLAAYDRWFELRGARRPAAPIVIVAIDESSFANLGLPWPFPRALHGKLIDRISAGRPMVIGVDLILDAPSSRGPADDDALAQAITHAGNVVLAAARTVEVRGRTTREIISVPIEKLWKAAGNAAPVNSITDRDAHVRRAPLLVPIGQDSVGTFAVVLSQIGARAGLAISPLPEQKEIRINFRGGPATFPHVAYHRVVDGTIRPETFRDKIVLVGTTSVALRDLFPTPFAARGTMPGVEIHANAIDTLLRGNRIREVPVLVSAIVALAAGLTASVLVAAQPRRAVLFCPILLAVVVSVTYVLFAYLETWFRCVGPMLALVLGLVGSIVATGERRTRDKIEPEETARP